MSYYLTDPYYYLPKSFPFLHNQLYHPNNIDSKRLTENGRIIEGISAVRRLQLMNRHFQLENTAERELLKCKYLVEEREINDHAEGLAKVVAERGCRQGNLRKTAHQFPNFVKSRQLIKDITENGKKVYKI